VVEVVENEPSFLETNIKPAMLMNKPKLSMIAPKFLECIFWEISGLKDL
jgi:hypothetical protein